MTGLQIIDLSSPNQADRPAGTVIDSIVLHYTGMQTGQAAVDRLRDPAPPTGIPVSSHYVIDEDGAILRLVPEARLARHAGISFWRGREGLNASSIGIEIVNPGHEWGYRDFPPAQIAAVREMCLDIIARQRCPAWNVVGHSDIAPDRKQDPGERFPWRELARQGVGMWPEGIPDLGCDDPLQEGTALRVVRMQLAAIGYAVAPEGDLDEPLQTVLRAFQRHWRPEAVTGLADAGTRARLAGVSAFFESV